MRFHLPQVRTDSLPIGYAAVSAFSKPICISRRGYFPFSREKGEVSNQGLIFDGGFIMG